MRPTEDTNVTPPCMCTGDQSGARSGGVGESAGAESDGGEHSGDDQRTPTSGA